jgi:hypothetical protein
MIQRIFIGVFVIFTATLICSCQNNGKLVKVQTVDSGVSVMTTADVRTIHHIKIANENKQGRIKPEYIICAEPSPDIAKAVADALNIGTSFDIKGLPSGIDPKVAAEISKARAEGVAQLTERLATIQLLRDTLYRACESYANGALTSTAYTLMLSRYDDIMITMLLGEFAAGGFGRSLSVIGSEAGSGSSFLSDVKEKNDKSRNSEKKLKELEKQLNDHQAKLDAFKELGDTSSPSVEELNSEIDNDKKMIDKTKNQLIENLKNETATYAKLRTATGVGEIKQTQDLEIAKTLATMQKKYIENINTNALEVFCITALSEDEGLSKKLEEFCTAYLEKSCEVKADILKSKLKVSNK